MLISAYSDGAPIEACYDFEPDHEPYSHQTTPAHYEIISSVTHVVPGGEVEIEIKGDDESFRGFLIQGKDYYNGQIIGQFVNPNEHYKTMTCLGGEPGNSATHTNATDKILLKLQWKAPAHFKGAVFFRATIVESYAFFWLGVESQRVIVG